MADQENTKSLTDNFNDVNMRISQAQAVLASLTQNLGHSDEDGLHFGEMSFTDVANTLWAIDTLLGQAKEFGNEGFKAACAVRYPNLTPIKTA